MGSVRFDRNEDVAAAELVLAGRARSFRQACAQAGSQRPHAVARLVREAGADTTAKRRSYTARVRQVARELRSCGMTLGDISEELGVPERTVYEWVVGVRKKVQPNAMDERELRRMWANGCSLATIAEALGVHPGSVQRRARELSLPRRFAWRGSENRGAL